MKVAVIGTRGFPLIQGGVEKHCESLYPFLASKEVEVTVFRRTPYLSPANKTSCVKNIKFVDLWTIRSKNIESVIHSFFAAIFCIFQRPDVVHIHNIGPALVLPLLRFGRLKTVVTYHSPNYEHPKWGPIGKWILKLGESFVVRLADQVIFVSEGQARRVTCPNRTHIPNGISLAEVSGSKDYIESLGLEPGKYILAVARFSPEKGLHDLLNAFMKMPGYRRLVMAGSADHETAYSRSLRQMAMSNPRVILTGYITGEQLRQVYSHAGLFVHPSHHEGSSIALLEALSYGLPVLASDIPANRELHLSAKSYFHCGDTEDLRKKMIMTLKQQIPEESRELHGTLFMQQGWNRIAEQTIRVYRMALDKHSELTSPQ